MMRILITGCEIEMVDLDCLLDVEIGETMKRLSIVILLTIVVLQMTSSCSAQGPGNDTYIKRIEGPTVKADQACWVDVHGVNEDKEAGELLGFTHLDAGVHEDVPILIRENDPSADRYLIEVHADEGEKDKFEPNGPDKILMRGWLVPEKIIEVPCISCPPRDGALEDRNDGNFWDVILLSDEEDESCGAKHPDGPAGYPYLSEEDGCIELKGFLFDDIE